MNAQEKAIALEHAVEHGDMRSVQDILSAGGTVCSADALNLACAQAGPEMVRTLLSCGASFSREFETHANTNPEPVLYERWYEMYVSGEGPLTDDQRCEVLEILHEHGCNSAFRGLLYESILEGRELLAARLLQLGENCLPDWKADFVSGRMGRYDEEFGCTREDRAYFTRCVREKSNTQLRTMIRRFLACEGVDRVALFHADFYPDGQVFDPRFCSRELFGMCMKYTGMAARVARRDMQTALVDEDNTDGIRWILNVGWLRSEAETVKLMQHARARIGADREIFRILSDYREEHYPASQRSAGTDPFEEPDPGGMWQVGEHKPGETFLLAYQGQATDVCIPSQVGNRKMGGIHSLALNPQAPNISAQQRRTRMRLTSVSFPGELKKIPGTLFAAEGAFPPETLREIELEDGIEVIDHEAFRAMKGLREIFFPDSVRVMGKRVCAACTSLGRARIGIPVIPDGTFERCSALRDIELGPAVQGIGAGAFRRTALRRVNFPSDLQILGKDAFRETALEYLSLPASVRVIGREAFRDCTHLREVKIAGNVRIGEGAFRGCTSLRSVEIEGTEEISESAFEDCSALDCIRVPPQVKCIGAHAFCGTAIREAVVPQNVREIGDFAFYGCRYLESILLPEDVSIGAGAFGRCPNLADLHGRIAVRGIYYGEDLDPPYAHLKNAPVKAEEEEAWRQKIFSRTSALIIPEGTVPDSALPLPEIVFADDRRPQVPFLQPQPDLTVLFGSFPQDGSFERLPLKWRVLRRERDRALLLADREILYLHSADRMKAGAMPGPRSPWTVCRMRQVLNNGFVQAAFSEEERARILHTKTGPACSDLVFCLSEDEVAAYLGTQADRKAVPTAYARQMAPEDPHRRWLTRDPDGAGGFIVFSGKTGIRRTRDQCTAGYLRPALWVRLAAPPQR